MRAHARDGVDTTTPPEVGSGNERSKDRSSNCCTSGKRSNRLSYDSTTTTTNGSIYIFERSSTIKLGVERVNQEIRLA